MKDIEKLISPLIESQFPDIYKDEGQNLIAFIKAYFEWMEDTNGVLYDSRRLPDYRDIDKTVDEFIDQFRTKYMHGIPKDSVVDKRILQKHIKEVYAAKGTTRGLQLLFRLLYNEDVEVYLPGDDVLKASDGRWYVPKYLEMEYNDTLPLYVGKIITGRVSGATAYVRDYQSFYIGSRRHDILYLEDLVGNFSATEEILNQEIIDDLQINITESPRVIGSMTSIEITSSEPGFTLGEVVTVNDVGFYGKAVVTGVKKLNGSMEFNIVDGGNGFTITPGSDVTVTPAFGDTPDSPASFEVGSITDTTTISLTLDTILPAASIVIGAAAPAYTAFSSNPTANVNTPFDEILEVNEYTYGKIASLVNIDPGDGYGANATVQVEDTLIYPLRIPDGNGGFLGYNANVEAIAGFGSGAIANVVVYDSGVGYTNGSIVTILSDSNTSIQALGVVTSNRNGVGAGYFSDSKGFLNSDKFVHDNFFYQDYSYQVKANLALNKYAGVLRDLWHPSGIERFGKIIVKDEYKSRGTTVEALMEWLESVEVTVSTNRFTSTSFATTLSTNYLTTTSRGTQYETERLTEYNTTFLTNISYTTTFLTTTIIDAATAIVVSRDTIKYISTSLNTLAERDTTTLISTAKTPATVTALSTVYATVTSKSTTTTYNTSSAIGFTSYATSTTTTTGTVFVTTVTKERETSYQTTYNTTQYDELNPTSDDGFLSEQAAIRAYLDLGLVEPEWSCSVYEYGPVFEGGYRYAYVCYPLVSTSTTRTTQKETAYGTTEGAYRLTSTTKSTDTTIDVTTAKSTSKSTTTAYNTDTTAGSFRLTSTSIDADTAYITSTIFERLTIYDTLPVRSTQTNRLSSTVFSTTYSTGMGFTTIDTSKDTSAITTTKYSTISSTKVATLTSYISTKTTAFDTTFATGIGFTTVETSKSTSFLADITKYQTSRDTQIIAGTQLITSIDTDKLVVYGTSRFTSYLTQYYDTSSDTNKSTDTTIVTSFDTYKLTSVKTYFLTSNITTIATEYLTAKETNLLTDTEFSTTINTMTTVLTRVFTSTYNTKFDTYTNTTTSFNTNRITTTNINSATMFETSLVTESATAFLTDTNYITIYSTEYRTVTYTDISTSFATSKATQLYTTTVFNTVFDTSVSTITKFVTNNSTTTNYLTVTKILSTTTVYDTAYATATVFDTVITTFTGTIKSTDTSKDTSTSTATSRLTGTTYSTTTTYDTTNDTNKTTVYGTDTTKSTSNLTDTSKTTTFNTTTTFDTTYLTDTTKNTTFDTTTTFNTSYATDTTRNTAYSTTTTYNTNYDTGYVAQDTFATLYVDENVTSASSQITIPATAQTGYVAVLFDYGYHTSVGVTNVLPSGWTNIANTANNSAGTGNSAFNCSYKILTSSDPGTTITGINSAGAGSTNSKIMLILAVGVYDRINTISVVPYGFNSPIDTAIANVSVALDGLTEGYTTSLIIGFYGASALPGTTAFLGEPIPFDEIEQAVVTQSNIAVKYQNAGAVETGGDTSVRLNMSDGGNKNILGGLRISVEGSNISRETTFSTSKATDTTISTAYSTDTTISTSKSTSTNRNTVYGTDTTKSTSNLTDTSKTTTFNTTTTFDTTYLTDTSKNTIYETTGSTSKSTDTSKSTTTTFNTLTTYSTVFETTTGALITQFTLSTNRNTDTVIATSTATDTVIDTLTSNITSTVFDTTKSTSSIYSTSASTSRSTATRGITTAETIGETFYDTNMTTKFSTSTVFDTTYDTNKLTSTIFLLTETSTNRSTSKLTQTTDLSGTIFSTSTTFNTTYNTNVYYDVTTFVTSKETAYSTNKSTSTTINSGTALITSVDTDTVFDTIIITNLSTEP